MKETKICWTCKKELPLNYFRTNKRRSDGLQTDCIECRKAYNRKHYLNNRKSYLEKAVRNRNKVILEVRGIKEKSKCEKCGDTRWYVLDFHHKNREDKSFSIGREMQSTGMKRMKEEIDKCSVLCSNCHRETEYLYRKRVNGSNGTALVSKTNI